MSGGDLVSLRVSLIVPTYAFERIPLLIECVNSLMAQSYPKTEIVVTVDRNEQLAAKLRQILPQKVAVILSSKAGLSEARNTGASHATGEIVAYIDDDAVPDACWVEKLVRNYQDPHVLAVGGRVEPIWPGRQPRWITESLYWIIGCSYGGLPDVKRQVRNPFGGNMSHRREVLNVIRFKSTLGRTLSRRRTLSDDETEFCINLSRVFPHGKIVYDPEAIVRHYIPIQRLSPTYFAKRAFREGLSKAMICRLYGFASLADERKYLRHAACELVTSKKWRVSKPYDLVLSFSQIMAFLVVLCATVFGFIIGNLRANIWD